MKRKAHILYLNAYEHAELQRLATRHKTLSPHGPTAGRPSFRVLIHRIAAGSIILTPTKRIPA